MKLSEFRAAHPGLYEQAFDAGVESERERVTGHIELGRAVQNDAIAQRAITAGAPVRDWLGHYEQAAGKNDQTARAFVRERDAILGAGAHRTPTTGPTVAVGGAPDLGDLVAARLEGRIDALLGTPPSRTATAGDIGDQVADMFDAARGKPATTQDFGDRVAASFARLYPSPVARGR